ncbi:MAG: thioredoxin, partial [Polyangiales bacterium]
SLLITAGTQLAERSDLQHGGMGGKPKFPSSSSHELLARAGRFPFGQAAKGAFEMWAKGMAEGGLYDHLGGGFARYSVDEKWLVPHFEKMLYDQAQLLGIYGDVVAQGGAFAARAGEVIAETVAFLERELSDAEGGLWSSLDADSEGEEGKFYVFTADEVRAALGKMSALVFNAAYGVTEGGTFEHGSSVLARVTPRASVGEEEQLAALREKLFGARAKRVRPGTDDKVLASWNGLAIAGLCAAWTATGQPAALALAVRIATFLRTRMITGGSLARVFHQGATKLDGTLEDYAFVADGFLHLAEATGDRAWWDLAAKLVATAREKFVVEEDGVVVMYLAPAGDPLLPHRPESHQDGAIPSGAAVLAKALLRLGLVAGDDSALALAEKYLVQRLAGAAGVNAWASSALLAAMDFYLHSKVVVVSDGRGRDALVAATRGVYSPTTCVAGPWASPSVLDAKTAAPDGAARAFVCTGPTCAPPVTEPTALVMLLAAGHAV